ncbi:zinc-dependent metalloprotease [Fusarium longipes]|uniref:Zinc-dependent metalloprotease n=1 Tax=Fusarium longipes TaxID=694270 RepID=A0A395T996_9HYPO|nr:zinc-dependent metalloprotease [Fusarium longipes]
MHSQYVLSLATLLISSVEAGSRLWETYTESSHFSDKSLAKRAISIKPSQDPSKDSHAVLLWPEKTLSYAYANDEAAEKLSPIFFQARQYWSQLTVKGFKYNELTLKKCKLYRDECLVIHYNDRGVLSSTVGRPPVNPSEDFHGPSMHLSDNARVGNLDIYINAAHELGHAWGLYHEHQNPKHWKIDAFDDKWPVKVYPAGDQFSPSTFHCENLKDYEKVLAGIKNELDRARICTSQQTAEKHDFSAKEWLPKKVEDKDADKMFDPNSLMLYPSGAGGKGDVVDGEDGRKPVLTYIDGKVIDYRTAPSTADLQKLITIYGNEYVGTSKLLIAKDSSMRRLVKKVRSTLSLRGGDTKDGLC